MKMIAMMIVFVITSISSCMCMYEDAVDLLKNSVFKRDTVWLATLCMVLRSSM